jgi:hypothetical protein
VLLDFAGKIEYFSQERLKLLIKEGYPVKKLLLVFVVFALSACAATTVQKDPVTDGRYFTDENYPSIKIEFPFAVEIKKSKPMFGASDNNVRYKYVEYFLDTEEKYTTVEIMKQNLVFSGNNAYFSRTDEKLIKNKLYAKQNGQGFCAVFANKYDDRNYIGSTVIQYSGRKHLTMVSIFEQLEDNYDFGRLENADKSLLAKHLGYAEKICSQLIGETSLNKIFFSADSLLKGKTDFSFLDEKTGNTWHILTSAGIVSRDTAEKTCRSLATASGTVARIPSLFELESLWRNHKGNPALSGFGGKAYMANDQNPQSNYGVSIKFSFSTGFTEMAFAGNLTCLELAP